MYNMGIKFMAKIKLCFYMTHQAYKNYRDTINKLKLENPKINRSEIMRQVLEIIFNNEFESNFFNHLGVKSFRGTAYLEQDLVDRLRSLKRYKENGKIIELSDYICTAISIYNAYLRNYNSNKTFDIAHN